MAERELTPEGLYRGVVKSTRIGKNAKGTITVVAIVDLLARANDNQPTVSHEEKATGAVTVYIYGSQNSMDIFLSSLSAMGFPVDTVPLSHLDQRHEKAFRWTNDAICLTCKHEKLTQGERAGQIVEKWEIQRGIELEAAEDDELNAYQLAALRNSRKFRDAKLLKEAKPEGGPDSDDTIPF
jgi:hypothetical protein